MKLRVLIVLSSLLISYFSITANASSLDQTLQQKSDTSDSLSSLLDSPSKQDNSFPSLDELSNDEEFLTVEQAYQLSITRTNQGLTLDWVIADEYFLYGEQFQFFINGTPIEATLPVGVIQYDPIFEKDVEKHYQHAIVTIHKDQLPDNQVFELTAISQGCADAGLCYPPHPQHFKINGADIAPLIKGPTAIPATAPNTESASLAKLLIMLCFAILGGIILNLMPCVLPVLSLKALSLANSTEKHTHQGWSYTVGVISTFVIMACLLLIIRTAGQAVGWGFQLQSPGFVTLLVYLFFVMGLSLSGHITIGTGWMNTGQKLTQGNGLKQSYFTGVLAAIVASPCTAPFMAPALGFAITQPWWAAVSIFAGLGLGMALPLLLLSHLPILGKWLPAPGAWMETFKQALAFPLYLTAIWLLWVLGRQLGINAAIIVVLGGLLIVFIYWLGSRIKPILAIAGLLTLVFALFISWHNSQHPPLEKGQQQVHSVWEPYSEQRLNELRQQGKAIFINMTADWCITCIANEKRVFTDSMLEMMKNKQIHLIKGDWTQYDPTITKLLEKYKRGGVPLYVLFPPQINAEGKLLPQILSPRKFKEMIESI